MKKLKAISLLLIILTFTTACANQKEMVVKLDSKEIVTDAYGIGTIKGTYKGPYGAEMYLNGEKQPGTLIDGNKIILAVESKDSIEDIYELEIKTDDARYSTDITVKNDMLKDRQKKQDEQDKKATDKAEEKERAAMKQEKEAADELESIKSALPILEENWASKLDEYEGILTNIEFTTKTYSNLKVTFATDLKFQDATTKQATMDEIGHKLQNATYATLFSGDQSKAPFMDFYYNDGTHMGISRMTDVTQFKLKN